MSRIRSIFVYALMCAYWLCICLSIAAPIAAFTAIPNKAYAQDDPCPYQLFPCNSGHFNGNGYGGVMCIFHGIDPTDCLKVFDPEYTHSTSTENLDCYTTRYGPTDSSPQTQGQSSGNNSNQSGEPTATAPQSTFSSADTITVVVCNTSSVQADVAVKYVEIETGLWITRGWFLVNSSECKTIFYTKNSIFYLYAQNQPASKEWSGEYGGCASFPNAFRNYDESQTQCNKDQIFIKFEEIRSGMTLGEKYTWNLGP